MAAPSANVSRRRPARLSATTVVAISVALALSLAAEHALAQPPSTADLAWIVGDWHGHMGTGAIEETWTPPVNGTLIGMFRWSTDEKIRLYEFFSIEDSDQGPVLYLRHFSPGLTAWEEKDSPMRYTLDAFEPGRFSFLNVTDEQTTRLTYTQTDGGMEVALDQIQGADKSTLTFVYSPR
ncbi:MAG: DUF6265 family protein [Acidobacteriota bacterium]